MSNEITMNDVIEENKKLKQKLKEMEEEINTIKHKLGTYQSNSKRYYENNKDKILERVTEYKATHKYTPTDEQKKKWARTAYLNRKKKLDQPQIETENN
jgi:bisphosphoglycerate-independent phosphoglycerate mutase (AlkP superfamily)